MTHRTMMMPRVSQYPAIFHRKTDEQIKMAYFEVPFTTYNNSATDDLENIIHINMDNLYKSKHNY